MEDETHNDVPGAGNARAQAGPERETDTDRPDDGPAPAGADDTPQGGEVPEAGGGPVPFDGDDDADYFEKLFASKKAEEEKKQAAVEAALAKFNVFLHLTAFVAGVAYLLLLGVLYRPALPWVSIPIVLWTVAIVYHFYRAFSRDQRKQGRGRTA